MKPSEEATQRQEERMNEEAMRIAATHKEAFGCMPKGLKN